MPGPDVGIAMALTASEQFPIDLDATWRGEPLRLRACESGWEIRHRCADAPRVDRDPLAPNFAAPLIRVAPGPHRIVVADPLTIEPDVHCERCGLRGRVTAGKWAGV